MTGAPASAASNELSLRGEYWRISYAGQTALMEDCRGLRYIAILIRDAAAGKGPIHARELVALASGQTVDPIELEAPEYVLDATARRQLMDRLEEIASERDRACAADELDRAAALDEEHERIAGELTFAAGTRGGGPGRRGAFSHAGGEGEEGSGVLGFFGIRYLGRRRQVLNQERMAAMIKGLHYAGVARRVRQAARGCTRSPPARHPLVVRGRRSLRRALRL